jgi:adenylate cyclase
MGCRTCGTEFQQNAKFCHECGTSITAADQPAEYKQVTVLFADVVGSMHIAAAVGPERLRELMGSVFDVCASVVQRYGGTVDKFTGDGIMAVFGAPIALEDHAFRACMAALDIQGQVTRRDGKGVDLQLRIGLSSGQVIAGEIGSGGAGYTAIGEQVGMAQRMESVAPPGGVMLSESTAPLVEGAAKLGEPEPVHIKGADAAVPAYRLLAISEHRSVARRDAALVGRRWEMAALAGILDAAVDGHGSVVRICGPPGIGKSRTVREFSALAAARGIEVFTACCESHTTDVPFHAVANLLRATTGATGLDPGRARVQVRTQVPHADPEDLLLFDDLLGIADPDMPSPQIDPDARRRRLTALVNAASLARTEPELYIVEDVHWIDEVSEAMLADFLTVIPQTHLTVVFTYRPEYQGTLSHATSGQMIGLAPLSDSQTTALVTELLGPDPSVAGLVTTTAERSAGNPFFAQELVRDLAERGVLRGEWGAYTSTVIAGEVSVPATLQAAIAARIDRLAPAAKHTLNAAAVIGSRFTADTFTALGIEPNLGELLTAELIDQVQYTPHPEYAFHHPLIRTVAYESQLKSARAGLHRRLAEVIDQIDDNSALIGEHLQAAGELAEAYIWHMRAGSWATNRDITAARTSWARAREVADQLPDDHPDRTPMRIVPRTLLCASTFRVSASVADTGFDELRELCEIAGDKVSLAIGMTGLIGALAFSGRNREASQLASEHIELLESIDDPDLIVGHSLLTMYAKSESPEMADSLRLAQWVITLADGDPAKGSLIVGSPLACAYSLRGTARWSLGLAGWREDLQEAVTIARDADTFTLAIAIVYKYCGVIFGVLPPDSAALDETAELLRNAERFGDNLALAWARVVRGIALVHYGAQGRDDALELLGQARDTATDQQANVTVVQVADLLIATRKARGGDLDDAIALSRAATNQLLTSGAMWWLGMATPILVEALIQRGAEGDLAEAQAAIETLAAIPTDPGLVLFEVPLLRMRALLAQANGDDVAYRDFRDRYRKIATDLGFQGHMAWAEAMP